MMKDEIVTGLNEILIYTDDRGSTSVEVILYDESLWLT